MTRAPGRRPDCESGSPDRGPGCADSDAGRVQDRDRDRDRAPAPAGERERERERHPDPPRTDTRDRGSASVLVLALLAVLSLVGATAVSIALALVTRHRADAAADLAALAAASRALDGPAHACREAGSVAADNGARLSACTFEGDVAVVTVEVDPPGRLAAFGPARTRARAGPG